MDNENKNLQSPEQPVEQQPEKRPEQMPEQELEQPGQMPEQELEQRELQPEQLSELTDDSWLDEILGTSNVPKELGADELAMSAAGLTHPDDLELERIVQETLAADWGSEEQTAPAEQPAAPVSAEEASDLTQRFVPQETPDEQANAYEAMLPAQILNADETEPEEDNEDEEEAEEAPLPKRRPRIKKGYGLFGIPHILSTAIWFMIVVAIGVSLGRMIWVCAADLLAFGKEPKEAVISIREEDTIDTIAQKLEDIGMVRYPTLFKYFAEMTGKGEDICVGEYTFSAEHVYDYNALIKAMIDYGPPQVDVDIMFPEGYSCAQVFQLLEDNGVCTVAELEEYAANGELGDYWFLEGVERGHKYCLEGFLAPDTYLFYTNDSPKRVLQKFLDEFEDRFDDRLREKYIELNQYLSDKMEKNGYSADYIASHQLTVQEVVILASMVEKESANNVESYSIASVFYNRLTNLGNYPFLNSDATILYAENYYNKGEINTKEDREKNPFNTYTNTGLPPSPICNPGLNSLGAALDPEDTAYYYFIYDKDIGRHRFSRTLAEHEEWARKLGLS